MIYGEVLVSVLVALPAVIWCRLFIGKTVCGQCFSTLSLASRRRWLVSASPQCDMGAALRIFWCNTCRFSVSMWMSLPWRQCTGGVKRLHGGLFAFGTKCSDLINQSTALSPKEFWLIVECSALEKLTQWLSIANRITSYYEISFFSWISIVLSWVFCVFVTFVTFVD